MATMETKLAELRGKLLALDLTITTRNKEALVRHETSISKKTMGLHLLKDEIEEMKFIQSEEPEEVRKWAMDIDAKLSNADGKLVAIRELLCEITKEKQASERKEAEKLQRIEFDVEREKQLAIEQAKFELQQKHKEEERKRDLEHQKELLERELQHQSQENKPKQVNNTKLPKLTITKFNGSYSEWLSFWNTFEAEIDNSDLPPVTKFGFLKEWLEPKVRADIDGLPFTTEGYQRAKNILKNEYGNTSEIINAHVSNIMGLPIISAETQTRYMNFIKHYYTMYNLLKHSVKLRELMV